ncbi:MAG: carbon-nitrogen hydrolase family protein [Pseudomonadota bacterium]
MPEIPRLATVACAQIRPMPSFEAALEEAAPLVEAAADQGAALVALPEYCGGLRSEAGLYGPPLAPEATHPVLAGLRALARRRGVWLLIGSLAVEREDALEDAGVRDERFANRCFLVDDQGEIVLRYDKIHLFDVALGDGEAYRESAVVAPGDAGAVAATPIGALGLTICYDLRFPHLYRRLAQAGAEALAVPAAFTRKTGEAHWHVLNRARAIENGAFVIAPCSTGPVEGGGACYGCSLIVDPWGRVLADAGAAGPGLAVAEIDLSAVAATRGRIPSLTHDRPFALPGEAAS